MQILNKRLLTVRKNIVEHSQGGTERVCLQPSSAHSGACSETSPWIWPASAAPERQRKNSGRNLREWGSLKTRIQTSTYLWWGNFNVDNDWSEGCFSKLCGVVDGVSVQNHQLQGFGKLKYPLNLTLNLRCTIETHFAYTYFITKAKIFFWWY